MEEPTVILPKLTLDGVSVTAGCVPVPETGMTALEPWEVVTVTLPEIVSADCGEKVTVKVADWPGVSALGTVMPLAWTSPALTEI